MFVNVNPTDADAAETSCSLQFASRVRGVELGAAKRHVEAGSEIRDLRSELASLRHQASMTPQTPSSNHSWLCPNRALPLASSNAHSLSCAAPKSL